MEVRPTKGITTQEHRPLVTRSPWDIHDQNHLSVNLFFVDVLGQKQICADLVAILEQVPQLPLDPMGIAETVELERAVIALAQSKDNPAPPVFAIAE